MDINPNTMRSVQQTLNETATNQTSSLEIEAKGKHGFTHTYTVKLQRDADAYPHAEVSRRHAFFGSTGETSRSIEATLNQSIGTPQVVGKMALSDGRQVDLKLSSRWPGVLQVGDDPNLTLSSGQVRKTGDGQFNLKDPEDFTKFYDRWNSDTLTLYRGVSSSHFSWDGMIKNHQVRSEGSNDIPTFTMGSAKTRWIPTADKLPLTVVVATGNHTSTVGDAMRDGQENILLGAVLGFDVGKTRQTPVCYLNSGETVVRGPSNSFRVSHLVVSSGGSYQAKPFSGTLDDLPQPAPYGPPGQVDDQTVQIQANKWIEASQQHVDKLIQEGKLQA